MNSLVKLIASISAFIASLSFAWIALSATGAIPGHHLTIHHDGGLVLANTREYTSGNYETFNLGLYHY